MRGSLLALDCAAVPLWGPPRAPAGASSLATGTVFGPSDASERHRPLPHQALVAAMAAELGGVAQAEAVFG